MQILVGVIVVLLIALGVAGWKLYGLVSRSDNLTATGPWPNQKPLAGTHNETEAAIAQNLLAAGLLETPFLNDTAITGHLARYRAGEVSDTILDQYVAALKSLGAFTSRGNVRIPAIFWDVRTREISAGNVTEYSLVNSLVQPGMETYIKWMSDSFARFTKFRRAEAVEGQDSALDAALDMMLYTLDCLDQQLKPSPTKATSERRRARVEQSIRMWQNIVAGTTRINPITKKEMVAHTFSSRFTIMEMWRYATGEKIGDSQAWGVSGFAERFVGDPRNINQIEHMSISAFLQIVLREPQLVLNAQEELELLIDHPNSPAMSRADMALNQAIAGEFAPYFADDPRGAVEHLRCYLKGTCQSRN